ncbi:hypothetical protein TPA0598_07_08020 [Streptomyces lydicamycinicus]|uniref:Type-1 mutarotase n=1 Tax=Streptomyces lydicamycinicus TaxID=1546107 RepID=A0A0P4RBX5_9ACTN|nr:hypothetical protein TPA0598_07_08020 [Streptomyces lydicamycinicus]
MVGLTNHAFWNLAGPGAHRPVDGHHVAVNAARVLRFDEDQVPLPGPTGPGRRHPAPPHWQRPGRRPAAGQLLRARHAAHLGGRPPRNPDSGRQLCLSTDQTGMGVSTGDGLHPPRAGPCLHPALARAPNRPDFPSARLDPGQTYTATTRYAFSVADRTPLPHPGPSPHTNGIPHDLASRAGPRLETAESAEEVHTLLRASDLHTAELYGLPVPERRLERSRALVGEGAVHLLRHGDTDDGGAYRVNQTLRSRSYAPDAITTALKGTGRTPADHDIEPSYVKCEWGPAPGRRLPAAPTTAP